MDPPTGRLARRPLPALASPLGVVAPTGVGLLTVVGLLFLGLPIAALLARAVLGGELPEALGRSVLIDALALSLVSTGVSLILTVVLGTPLAFVLARRSFRGKRLFETIIDLPIVLPPSVAGLALLLAFGRRGIAGEPLAGLGVEVAFSTLAVVLAQTFVAAPLYIRSARAGFSQVHREIEDAARVDGASEAGVFRLVTLPLASAAIAAGLTMTWARALGEFGATIMFAGNIAGRTQTLPLLVYSEFQSSLDTAVAAAAILAVAAFGFLFGARVLGWRTFADIRTL